MIGFWLILAGIIGGNLLWWRWADVRLRPLPGARAWRLTLALFILLQLAYLAAFVLAPQWARRSHFFVPSSLLGVVYLWGVLVLPITGVVTLLLTLGAWMVTRLRRRTANDASPATGVAMTQAAPIPSGDSAGAMSSVSGDSRGSTSSLTRRQLISAAAVAVPPLLTGLGVMYGRRSLLDLQVTHTDVPIPNLPDHLDGVTIAHVTDCHVGKFVRERHLKQVVEMTNALNADLHLLTGDLIDLSIDDLPLALDFLGRLKPAHALVMCEGNHDLIDDAKAFYAGAKQRNIPLLANESMTIRLPRRSTPLRLMGLKWGMTRIIDENYYAQWIRGLAGPREKDGPLPILLAHHPHAFDAAAAAGVPLTLAGHTHGGLLMLSERVGPGPLLYRYWSGLYRKDNSALYVSKGVGTWFPLRTHARPEIAHLTLRRA